VPKGARLCNLQYLSLELQGNLGGLYVCPPLWWESDMTSGAEFPVTRLQPAVTYMRISVLSQHKSPRHPSEPYRLPFVFSTYRRSFEQYNAGELLTPCQRQRGWRRRKL